MPRLAFCALLGKHNHAILLLPLFAQNTRSQALQLRMNFEWVKIFNALALWKPRNHLNLRLVEKFISMLPIGTITKMIDNDLIERIHHFRLKEVFNDEIAFIPKFL